MKIDWGFWEVLIGITAIALATIPILLALASVALYFWGKPWLEDLVKKEVEEKEKELRGRLVGYVGFIFGRLRVVRDDFIHPAIAYSNFAYEVLPANSSWRMRAINNLAFYYSIRGYITDAPAAIRYAKMLLEEYSRSPAEIDWLTTYGSVVGKYFAYFDNPKRTLMEAEKMMEEIQGRGDVAPDTKQSAAGHLEAIRAALKKLS